MEELLLNLGRKPNFFQRVRLVGLFMATTAGFLVMAHVLNAFSLWNPLTIHLLGWTIWFAWQGWLFPVNRARYIQNYPDNPYRKAFYWDILFGVSFGVSQMVIPVSYGILAT